MEKQLNSQTSAECEARIDLAANIKLENEKSLRWLGCNAIVLGFIVMFSGMLIYGMDNPFTSISASANFYGTACLLPFVLGGMSIFFWNYRGYEPIDRITTKTMSIAAVFVALFQCSEFGGRCTPSRISLLGLPPEWSNAIHLISAITLFGALIFWLAFLFTKTTKGSSWKKMTPTKRIRNIIYYFTGAFAFVGLIFTVLNLAKITEVPYVWLWEEVILIPSGFALLVKSGLPWFADKPQKKAIHAT